MTSSAELEHFRTKTYEEIPKHDHVYINKEVAELNSDRHKLGKAIDEKRRESQFNTGRAGATSTPVIRTTRSWLRTSRRPH